MLDNNFLFGAATSAYQIEGAHDQEGKGQSIWDLYSRKRGYITNGHTGDIACNHYHRWEDDVELMATIGLQAYRFSISWSRVFPKGYGRINKKGIEFYKNLVDALVERDIEPFVTLYHWDLPANLNWANPKIIKYFAKYAEIMRVALPDVKYWITINEPAVFVNNFWGHNNLPKAIRNVLLAHATADRILRELEDTKVGISLNLIPIVPRNSEDEEDRFAAESVNKRHNRVWLDPLYKGKFPEGINKLFGFKDKKIFFTEDEVVASSTDFLGVNYYSAEIVRYDKNNPLTHAHHVPDKSVDKDEMGTEIHPDGLFYLLKNLKIEYNNPEMYITENGCACPDTRVHDGGIYDFDRIKYIRSHLRYANAAVENKIDLKGYFYWSLMDNFEWRLGYTKRFGLFYVDYPTQTRIPKDSTFWYEHIIKDETFRKRELYENITGDRRDRRENKWMK